MANERPDGYDLIQRAGHERPPREESAFHHEKEGPTGRAPGTESHGDPGRTSVADGAQQGAGAGILAGTAVAGPIGMPIGAAIGAVVGGVAEAADEEGGTNEGRALSAPASEGTGPVDPAIDFVRNDRG
jgi:hypothetical protein